MRVCQDKLVIKPACIIKNRSIAKHRPCHKMLFYSIKPFKTENIKTAVCKKNLIDRYTCLHCPKFLCLSAFSSF